VAYGHRYIVERMRGWTGFQQIAAVQEPTRTYNNTAVTLDSSYLNRVRAVFSNAGTFDYSNRNLATSVG
jgi:hypothetical protein